MPSVSTPQSVLRCGVSRVDITPPVGVYHRMWGAAVHDRAEGVHRPLLATLLALRPGSPASGHADTLLLLALDHCLLGRDEMAELVGVVSNACGVPQSQILVAFSHTHAAGLMSLDRRELPGGDLIEPYLKKMSNLCGTAAKQAVDRLQPATIVYGTGRCDLAAQRDFWDEASQQFVCGYNPSVRADDTVLIGRITSDAGEPLATLVNYACHPTTLAFENRLISPDYIGTLRDVVERATKGAPCLYLHGASGDMGPKEGFVGDVAVADRNGRQLGYAVLSTLESLPQPKTHFVYKGPVISGATLGIWKHEPLPSEGLALATTWKVQQHTVPFPYRDGLPKLTEAERRFAEHERDEKAAAAKGDKEKARDLRALAERDKRLIGRLKQLPAGEAFPWTVSVWRLGQAVWVGVMGEYYSQFQTAVRAAFPNQAVFVITMANGWGPSYLPPKELYGKGIYQESIALLAPGSLERAIEETIAAIRKVV